VSGRCRPARRAREPWVARSVNAARKEQDHRAPGPATRAAVPAHHPPFNSTLSDSALEQIQRGGRLVSSLSRPCRVARADAPPTCGLCARSEALPTRGDILCTVGSRPPPPPPPSGSVSSALASPGAHGGMWGSRRHALCRFQSSARLLAPVFPSALRPLLPRSASSALPGGHPCHSCQTLRHCAPLGGRGSPAVPDCLLAPSLQRALLLVARS